MSLTINAKTFTADSFQKDSVGYSGPAKTVSVKDDLVLRRAAAKASATFSGQGNVWAKLTRTLSLTGAVTSTGDIIGNVNIAAPVGFTAADVDTFCTDLGAYVSSAQFKNLVKTQVLSY